MASMAESTTQTSERFFATPEEYLAFEAEAVEKHEWIDGEVVPLRRGESETALGMAGGSVSHALVGSNVAGELRQRLKGSRCRVYSSDLRIRTPKFRHDMGYRGLYTYPDATIVCGKEQVETFGKNIETLTNPTLLIEVLSPSTESHDRGTKFERYGEIESFREYVLVSQDEPKVSVFLRRDNGDWKITHYEGVDATARLDTVEADLPLAEVYANVTFPPRGASAEAEE
jgi:Uma2 family endonuclease